MTEQNSILKGRSPQFEPREKKNNTKIHDLTRPGSNLRPIACEANDIPHYATVVRSSAAENTGCTRGAYLRRKLVSSKTIPTTKTTSEKFSASHVFQCCPY